MVWDAPDLLDRVSLGLLSFFFQYACACSASYLKSYQLCFSNCTHIPPYSLYRDFCISNGWFNNNNINGTTQNVNNGTSSGNNSTKPGSALGYPTRGCMTNQCRKCITACDPGVLTYDQVVSRPEVTDSSCSRIETDGPRPPF